MDHAHAGGTRVEWHLDSRVEKSYVEADRGANPQFGVSFIDDRDCGLPVAEDVAISLPGRGVVARAAWAWQASASSFR